MRILYAQWQKTKRTGFRPLLLLLPLVFALTVSGYCAYRHLSQGWRYRIFFLLWTSLVTPLFAGVITTILAEEEGNCGGFTGFLLSGEKRWVLYLGKFFFGVLCHGFAVFLGATLMALKGGFPDSLYWEGALCVTMSSLPLFAIHLPIALYIGPAPNLILSILGVLSAALFGATVLGESLWPFFPWAEVCRWSLYPSIPSLGKQGLGLLPLYALGRRMGLLYLFLFFFSGLFLFDRWEGRGPSSML